MPRSYTFDVFMGSSQGKIVRSVTRRTLEDDEVLVRITHAGLCASDLQLKYEDMVLGHEGVGVVQEVGSAVKSFKRGDRAGWGFLHDSCLECNDCLTGNEIFCENRKLYSISDRDQGGFGSWKAAFLFHIPDAIASVHAAPLMCAGTTVFNAMEMHGLRPTERVGILGLGGLGHLAIQFAAKMGCEVVVFSRTASKEAEAIELGATKFHTTQGIDALQNVTPIKHLYVTTSAMPDWENPSCTCCNLSNDGCRCNILDSLHGCAEERAPCPMVAQALHAKMLHFVAQHHVKPVVQQFPLSVKGIEEAMRKLENGEVRYRAVLVAGPMA